MVSRLSRILIGSSKLLNTPILFRTSVTISWPYKRGHDFFRYKDLLSADLAILEKFAREEESDPENIAHMVRAYVVSRENLAKLMGVDPLDFNDHDVRAAIRYLFPSDLTKKYCRPKLKELDTSYQENVTESVPSGYFAMYPRMKEAMYLIQRCIFELRNTHNSQVSTTDELLDIDQIHSETEQELIYKLRNKKDLAGALNEKIIDKSYDRLQEYIQILNDIPGHSRYFDQISHLVHLPNVKEIETKIRSINSKLFEGKTLVQQYTTTAVCGVTYGTGDFTVNNQSYLDYFPEIVERLQLLTPLRQSQTLGYVDVTVEIINSDNVSNKMQEARCIRTALSRALAQYVPDVEPLLKEIRVLNPQLLEKEYKKAGKKGPRHRYPWRKR